MSDAWHSYSGNMHIHTRFSDGEKLHADIAHDAIAAGLDFIIVTDHNVHVTGVEGYYQNERGRYFSEGEFEILGYPRSDGYDALTWICLLYTSPSPRD